MGWDTPARAEARRRCLTCGGYHGILQCPLLTPFATFPAEHLP